MINNNKYYEQVKSVLKIDLPFNELNNKTVVISGANGMIGKSLIDVLMCLNNENKLNIEVIAICRNKEKATDVFKDYFSHKNFQLMIQDINDPIDININKPCYIFHLASNSHPIAFSNKPIDTLLTNIIGLKNMLDLAADNECIRFFFASSGEIYGDNRNGLYFNESDCGYIDCNSTRAAYNEGKRAGEALCNAYSKEKGVDFVIARIARAYGPTLKKDDSKALSQFIFNGLDNKDIILKSDGSQLFSYIYIFDVISAILTILLKGKSDNAYNVSNDKSNVKLKDLASIVAKKCNRKLIFNEPNKEEKDGYSKSKIAFLDSSKLLSIGWLPQYDLESGINSTIDIIKETYK